MGQLRAVTGAGKTPILAQVVGTLGDAMVIWTTRSSAVVEQTYNNLKGKYRSLLHQGGGVEILRDLPSQSEWQSLLHNGHGLTVWVVTVGSWNELEYSDTRGSDDARLYPRLVRRPEPLGPGPERPQSTVVDRF